MRRVKKENIYQTREQIIMTIAAFIQDIPKKPSSWNLHL